MPLIYELDLVRQEQTTNERLKEKIAREGVVIYPEHQGLECGGPRPVLKKAFAEGLIATVEEADVWWLMLEDCNLTSHAYDETLATRIYQHVVRDYSHL